MEEDLWHLIQGCTCKNCTGRQAGEDRERGNMNAATSIAPKNKKTKPNAKCHCGSVKKYKKCCMTADTIAISSAVERQHYEDRCCRHRHAYAKYQIEQKQPLYKISNYFIRARICEDDGEKDEMEAYLQKGVEEGCIKCFGQRAKILFEGNNRDKVYSNRDTFYLKLPWLLEAAIRGYPNSMCDLMVVYRSETQAGLYECNALQNYWLKMASKSFTHHAFTDKNEMVRKDHKREHAGSECNHCEKKETTEKKGLRSLRRCRGCEYKYYCSDECARLDWTNGHRGECKQLQILHKYHEPHHKEISQSFIMGGGLQPHDGSSTTMIPELQTLRQKLGLNRPRSDYEEYLLVDDNDRSTQMKFISPRNDGTVQIGSIPSTTLNNDDNDDNITANLTKVSL